MLSVNGRIQYLEEMAHYLEPICSLKQRKYVKQWGLYSILNSLTVNKLFVVFLSFFFFEKMYLFSKLGWWWLVGCWRVAKGLVVQGSRTGTDREAEI